MGGRALEVAPRIKHPTTMLGRIIIRCDDCNGKMPAPYVPMSVLQAARVARFVARLAPVIEILFVHCELGLGRSPGAGRAIADAYGIPMENIAEDWKFGEPHNAYIESVVAKALAALGVRQVR